MALISGFIGYTLILSMVLYALQDGWLTPKQMMAKNIDHGIPLVAHAGIIGDALYLAPIIIYIIGNYADQWSRLSFAMMFMASWSITIPLGLLWMNGSKQTPEALAHDGYMTKAGNVHIIFMVLALTVILLFYFFTNAPIRILKNISIIIALHVFAASHIPLSILKPKWYKGSNYKDPLSWGTFIAVTALLAWKCDIL
jgi:hypothetical protein